MEKNCAKLFAKEWSLSFCLNESKVVEVKLNASDERIVSLRMEVEDTFLQTNIVCGVSNIAKISYG